MTFQRFQLASAVHLLLLDGENLLLLRRFNTGYQDGSYGLIAGHLDGDEPVRKALAREALEEAGIIVDPADLRFVHVTHTTRRAEMPDGRPNAGEYVHFFFSATKWDGTPRNAEPEKCDDLRWFPIDVLPPNVVPHVRSAIRLYRQGIPFSEFGWDS